MSDENIHSGRRQFLKQSAEAVVGAGALLTGSFGTVEAQLGSTSQGSGRFRRIGNCSCPVCMPMLNVASPLGR